MNGGTGGWPLGAPTMQPQPVSSGMHIGSSSTSGLPDGGEHGGGLSGAAFLAPAGLPGGSRRYSSMVGAEDLAALASDVLLEMALNAQQPQLPTPTSGAPLQLLSERISASGPPPVQPPQQSSNAGAAGIAYGVGNANGLGLPTSPVSGSTALQASAWHGTTGPGPSHQPGLESWHAAPSDASTTDDSIAALLLAFSDAAAAAQWSEFGRAASNQAAAMGSGLLSPTSLPANADLADLNNMANGYIQLGRPWSGHWHGAHGAGPSAQGPASHDPLIPYLQVLSSDSAALAQHQALLDAPRLSPSSWGPALPGPNGGGRVGGSQSHSGLPPHPHSVGGVLGGGAGSILSGNLLSAGALEKLAGGRVPAMGGPSTTSSASAQLQSCISSRVSIGTPAGAALLSGPPSLSRPRSISTADASHHHTGWMSSFTPLDLGPNVVEREGSREDEQELVNRAVAAASQLLQSLQVSSQEPLQHAMSLGSSTVPGSAVGRDEQQGQDDQGSSGGGAGDGATGQPGEAQPISTRHSRHKLYKTEMCRNWTAQGTCPYGVKCQFAHGSQELRVRGSKAKATKAEGTSTPPAEEASGPGSNDPSTLADEDYDRPSVSDRPSMSSERTSAFTDRPSGSSSDRTSILSDRTSASIGVHVVNP